MQQLKYNLDKNFDKLLSYVICKVKYNGERRHLQLEKEYMKPISTND